jgi:hypothetical protein
MDLFVYLCQKNNLKKSQWISLSICEAKKKKKQMQWISFSICEA